jgi:hypothetical protein
MRSQFHRSAQRLGLVLMFVATVLLLAGCPKGGY